MGEFTAPEVRQSKANYRNPVDVYSLGQVLYYWMFFKNSPPLAKEEKDNTRCIGLNYIFTLFKTKNFIKQI